MRFAVVAATLFLGLVLTPSAAHAQDADSVLAARIRNAENYPQGRDVFKEGKKDLKEALKALRKDGLKAYYEVVRDQQKD